MLEISSHKEMDLDEGFRRLSVSITHIHCFSVTSPFSLPLFYLSLSSDEPVCLFLPLSVSLSVYSYLYLSACLSILTSICQPVCLFLPLSVSLSVYSYLYLSACLSILTSICQPVCLFLPLSVSLSVYSYLYLSACLAVSHFQSFRLSIHLRVSSPLL